ncbi:hypothetical protein ACFE04_017942 [Oxalis oulophora]
MADDVRISNKEGWIFIKNRINDLPESLVPVTVLGESGNSSRSRTCWKPAMDLYFIDLMLDQVHKGGIVCGSFGKQAWKEMITAFNAKFGCNSKVKSNYLEVILTWL